MHRIFITNRFRSRSIVVLATVVLSGCSFQQPWQMEDVLQYRRNAVIAYGEKNYDQAIRYYHKALKYDQDNAIVAYNLACCYALRGDAEGAAQYLSHSINNGFRNLTAFYNDTDFNPVRNSPVFTQTVKNIEDRFHRIGETDYVETRSLQLFRIRQPNNYDSMKTYPLLIGMHGAGGNSEGFVALYENVENPQFIFVAAEGQYRSSKNIGPQWQSQSWALLVDDKTLWRASDELVDDYILGIIDRVSAKYKIGDVYLMGFSQGAVYAYTIALKHPEEISGVIGLSGYLMDVDKPYSILSTSDILKGKTVRIFIGHGKGDGAVSVETGQNLFNLFRGIGYDVSYREFDGRHQITPDILNRAIEWMYEGAGKSIDVVNAAEAIFQEQE